MPAAPVCTDVAFLEEALDAVMLRAFGGQGPRGEWVQAEKGVAGVQAVKLSVQLKAQLDAARLLAAGEGDMSEAALIAKIEEAAVDMPSPHLEIFVRAYCTREGLDWPRRLHAGGLR